MDNTKEKKPFICYISCLFVTVMLSSGFMFLVSSCEQEGEMLGYGKQNPMLSTEESVIVNFTVGERVLGINDVVIRNKSLQPSEERQYFPLSGESDGALHMYATLTKDDAPVKLRTSLLDPETKLRVVAYTNTGSGYTTKLVHTDYVIDAGLSLIPYGTPPMMVPSGTIKFVAYSFNDTITMPVFTDITAAIADRDLLWGDTIVSVGPGNTSVHIILDHLFSKIKLQASLNPAVGTNIDAIGFARFTHTFSTLSVQSGNLTPGVSSQLPFTWQTSIPAPTWDSYYHPVYTNGDPPGIEIDNVTIDGGTPYTGPWPINYTTPLVSGHEYTLSVYFTRTFFNVQATYTGARDSCGPNTTPGIATYTVPAGTYSSTVSQADADSMAQDDIIQNAQTWINSNAACIPWQRTTVRPYSNPGTYTWTVPNNVRGGTVDVFLVGGGGGGGGGNGLTACGGGGGGGFTQTFLNIPVTPGQQIQVIIGAGGIGGWGGGAWGANGGYSEFMNSSYRANGGGGGAGTQGIGVGIDHMRGGHGGSGGGGGQYSSRPGAGGSDGANGSYDITNTYPGGTGQGTTTRDFGEPSGLINAGGGGGGTNYYPNYVAGGASGYSQGSGIGGGIHGGNGYVGGINAGGGYGGGGGGANAGTFNVTPGGDGGAGTVLIRYYY